MEKHDYSNDDIAYFARFDFLDLFKRLRLDGASLSKTPLATFVEFGYDGCLENLKIAIAGLFTLGQTKRPISERSEICNMHFGRSGSAALKSPNFWTAEEISAFLVAFFNVSPVNADLATMSSKGIAYFNAYSVVYGTYGRRDNFGWENEDKHRAKLGMEVYKRLSQEGARIESINKLRDLVWDRIRNYPSGQQIWGSREIAN